MVFVLLIYNFDDKIQYGRINEILELQMNNKIASVYTFMYVSFKFHRSSKHN